MHVLYSVIVWFLIERSQGTILLHFYIFNPRQIGMLNFYPFTLANSHVMLLLMAAITPGITADPQEKSCLFSVSVYGWRLYQVDAINQFRHMIKTKGLKRPINLFRCVPCPTFTTHFSSSIYVGLNSAPIQVCLPSSSLSFVFLVICIRFSPRIHSCLLQ